MMKARLGRSRYALLGMLMALVPNAAVMASQEAAESSLEVACDPRVELMSILMRIAGTREYNQPAARSPYAAQVDEWFTPFKGHAAVQSLLALRSQHGISYDAPMSFAMHLRSVGELEELVPFDLPPERLDKRWPLRQTRAFMGELEDFVLESSFLDFSAAHADFYNESARRMRLKLEERSYLPWLKEFFGVPPAAQFRAIPGLLNGGANYGMGVIFADRSQSIAPIIGIYSWDEDGLPLFGDDFVATVVHEFVHSYTNHLVDEHWETLQEPAERIFRHCKGLLGLQAYGSPRIMMYESLVRACVSRYLSANEGRAALAKHLRGQEDVGFVWIPQLAEALAAYEDKRSDFETFEDYMPAISTFFGEYATEYEQLMKAAPHVISIEPDLSKPVDPTADELVITFDRPMVRGSFSITKHRRSPRFGTPAYDPGERILRVPMQLEAGTGYGFSLNNKRYRGFKTAVGLTLDPHAVSFRTAAR